MLTDSASKEDDYCFLFWNLACVLNLIDSLAAEYEGKLTCGTFPALQFPQNPAASLLGNPARVKFSFDTVLASDTNASGKRKSILATEQLRPHTRTNRSKG